MFTQEQNIEVFRQTRELSYNDYIAKETQKLINNTKVYREPSRCSMSDANIKCNVTILMNDTVSVIWNIRNHSKDAKIAALNFADPYVPGGLVEQGANTQEESLCRCSNLYESLIKEECISEYYNYNKSLNNNIFSDRIIYSKNVVFFRDNITYNITNNYATCDIITSPAPLGDVRYQNEVLYNKTITNRIESILKVAMSNDIDVLILGAWGCGAFHNRPKIIAKAFHDAICNISRIKNIIFAIPCPNNVPDNTYSTFETILKN